jgi:hypothetical protein
MGIKLNSLRASLPTVAAEPQAELLRCSNVVSTYIERVVDVISNDAMPLLLVILSTGHAQALGRHWAVAAA